MPEQQVAVIGAGVSGLTTAYRLAEAGFRVSVFARETTPLTTSDVAPALWWPGALSMGERQHDWALESLRVFLDLAERRDGLVDVMDLYSLRTRPGPVPQFGELGPVRPVQPGMFPNPWRGGYSVPAPRIDVPLYMPWLMGRVKELGVTLEQRVLASFGDVESSYVAVVNCAGLGATTLTEDKWLHPVRGQAISVRKPENFPDHMILANDRVNEELFTYIIPRSGDCNLGGTMQPGSWDLDVDANHSAGILARCSLFHPELAQAEVLEQHAALRPGREVARLELESLPDGRPLVHNYGHGSHGYTFSWGCGAEVTQIVQAALAKK